MARKRLISPEFFTHADLFDAEVACGLPLRLAFAGLWTQCDRRGLFRWRPRELKVAILPYDALDFAAVLDALASAGFIERYVVDYQAFGRIPKFSRWQTFHPHERPSDVPAPVETATEPTKGGPEPDNVRRNPSVVITGTVSSTVTGTSTVPGPADADPASPRRKRAPDPTATEIAVQQAWADNVGEASVALIRKHLGAAISRHGESAMCSAIADYATTRKANSKACRLDWLAQEIAMWVPRRVVNDDGTPNDLGMAILAGGAR